MADHAPDYVSPLVALVSSRPAARQGLRPAAQGLAKPHDPRDSSRAFPSSIGPLGWKLEAI